MTIARIITRTITRKIVRKADHARIVLHCLEQLLPVRDAFARAFYQRLFEALPGARAMYVHDARRQEMLLFAVLSMAMKALDAGRDLGEEMREFGRIHRRAGVRDHMFPVFGAIFLDSMCACLPEDHRRGLATSWWIVYDEIAAAIIAGMHRDGLAKRDRSRLFGARPPPAP